MFRKISITQHEVSKKITLLPLSKVGNIPKPQEIGVLNMSLKPKSREHLKL